MTMQRTKESTVAPRAAIQSAPEGTMRATVAPDHDDASGDAHQDIREGVRRLCAQFDGAYWRALDRERAYPSDFVRALTEAGYLAILVPEAYGGAGLPLSAAAVVLEEIHRSGGNGAACHAQMYTMGTLLRHGGDLRQPAPSACRLSASPNPAAAPTPAASPPSPAATATATSSTARRSGSRAPSTPTSCCCSAAPPRVRRDRGPPTA